MSTPYAFVDALSHVATPEWLADDRRAALERFLAAGLPDTRQEAWKYTRLEQLGQTELHAPVPGGGAACPDLSAYPGHVLAYQNGQLVCHGTYLPRQVAGTLRHLGETQAVREHLGQLTGQASLASLNLALWTDGTRLYVPAGKRLNLSVFALYGVDEADAMSHPRTLAVLEKDGEAVLVEHFLGQTDRPYWQNAVAEIFLADGARLTHVRVVEEGASATHTGLTAVRLGRGSEYRALHVGLGGQLARHDLMLTLEGADSQVRIDGFDLADGRRHTDLHLRVVHRAADTASRINWRGMGDERGQAVFDGHVVVERTAHRADARQSCRGMLLSPHSEVDAMPRLEIYADDVKCSHGASIGSLDPEALFYLRSRGIDLSAARRLLLRGFASEALGLLDETRLTDWLMPSLDKALARRTNPEESA